MVPERKKQTKTLRRTVVRRDKKKSSNLGKRFKGHKKKLISSMASQGKKLTKLSYVYLVCGSNDNI